MPGTGHGNVRKLKSFTDADAAVEAISKIYNTGAAMIRDRLQRFRAGERQGAPTLEACYPYLGITAGPNGMSLDSRPSYGTLPYPGTYGTTLTRPDLFADYYREQIQRLLRYQQVPVVVGISDRPIPLPFVVEDATADITAEEAREMSWLFRLPDLSRIDDTIANGTNHVAPGQPLPLSLFPAERTDIALQRLHHYTGTAPEYFQRFVLFTNYQRYVDAFILYAEQQVREGSEYSCFVRPGGGMLTNPRLVSEPSHTFDLEHLPQMPAYHLVRPDSLGITLVNIGVGPSNARTITDHIAVLRPHCWLMIGHCGGLRRSQLLGDYALAHAYIREDHVLDQDLPTWVPVPPIAEIQVALQQAVMTVTGLSSTEIKSRMRTGTVASTDNRNWELRYAELQQRFSQSRAIAVDMESATIAANGFRLRVPYGTLLCVSDKPMHGEIKLRGMANAFYRERISQHLDIGLEAVRILRQGGVEALHSRKLRSFDEPPFR